MSVTLYPSQNEGDPGPPGSWIGLGDLTSAYENWYISSGHAHTDKTLTLPPFPASSRWVLYDPSEYDSGGVVAATWDVSDIYSGMPELSVYWKTGANWARFDNVDPGGDPTRTVEFHYEIKVMSSDPEDPRTWVYTQLFGGTLVVDPPELLTTVLDIYPAVELPHDVWVSVIDSGPLNPYYDENDLYSFFFPINHDFSTGMVDGVACVEIAVRNLSLVLSGGGAPPITPALRMGQRNDGAGGVTGHARQNNGGANQPSSVQDSRSPRLPETIANRYV